MSTDIDEAKRARQREGWVRRADWSGSVDVRPAPSNPSWSCHTPTVELLTSAWPLNIGPDGAAGDVWRCPECSRLWWVVDLGPHRGLHWDRVPVRLRVLHWAGWWP